MQRITVSDDKQGQANALLSRTSFEPPMDFISLNEIKGKFSLRLECSTLMWPQFKYK